MRTYDINGEQILLLYRYLNEGFEITAGYDGKIITKHYQSPDLTPYSELLDLIDDLSYKFIKEELSWIKTK